MAVLAKAESPSTARPSATSRGEGETRVRRNRNPGLLLVGLFKLGKALFFGGMGFGALHLLHRNVGELVMRLVALLPFDPEGRFVGLIMDRADLIGSHQLRQVGLYSILYACVCVVEGIGLMLEKTWAEYFTVVLTTVALPYEIFELVREPSSYRGALLGLNLLVLVYLVWLLRRARQKHAQGQA